MKITKQYLKQIIKESLQEVDINLQRNPGTDASTDDINKIIVDLQTSYAKILGLPNNREALAKMQQSKIESKWDTLKTAIQKEINKIK